MKIEYFFGYTKFQVLKRAMHLEIGIMQKIFLSFIVVNIRKQEQFESCQIMYISFSLFQFHMCAMYSDMMSLHKLIFSTSLLIFRSFLI